MTRAQSRLLALFDQMEAMGLRCGTVSYWKGSRQRIPSGVDLADLHAFLWQNPDALELLEVAYDLKREAEFDLMGRQADEAIT